mmetsp:Transcript_100010/g.283068  ORF Transcript_100010/g.283068 Transcript_100010/m.283068 type:complete len:500 (+) Transcript_100010:666-2165(+)
MRAHAGHAVALALAHHPPHHGAVAAHHRRHARPPHHRRLLHVRIRPAHGLHRLHWHHHGRWPLHALHVGIVRQRAPLVVLRAVRLRPVAAALAVGAFAVATLAVGVAAVGALAGVTLAIAALAAVRALAVGLAGAFLALAVPGPVAAVAHSQALLAHLAPLGEAHVQRLPLEDLEVHLRDRHRRLVGRRVAQEAEALAFAAVVLGRRQRYDRAELPEELPQRRLVGVLVEVLEVEVAARHPVAFPLISGAGTARLGQLLLALRLRLGALHVELVDRMVVGAELLLAGLLAGGLDLLVGAQVQHVQRLHAGPRVLGRLVVHEREGPAPRVRAQRHGGDGAELGEHLAEPFLVPVGREALDVQVRVVLGVRLVAVGPLHHPTDVHGVVADVHAIAALDGDVRSLLCLEVYETIAIRGSVDVRGDFAGDHVAEEAEGVVQGLVVDARVQILDVDVVRAGLALGWVPLAPQDPARSPLDLRVVERLQGAVGIGHVLEVHIRVA